MIGIGVIEWAGHVDEVERLACGVATARDPPGVALAGATGGGQGRTAVDDRLDVLDIGDAVLVAELDVADPWISGEAGESRGGEDGCKGGGRECGGHRDGGFVAEHPRKAIPVSGRLPRTTVSG